MQVKCGALGGTNLNIFWPIWVNGIPIVNTKVVILSQIKGLDGRLAFVKKEFVRTEKIKTNSVRMLPINQLVRRTSGEMRKNKPKNMKSNTMLIKPKIIAIIMISLTSYFLGDFNSFLSTSRIRIRS